MRYAQNGVPNMAFQHRPPGDQRELQRFFDQGEASARQIDRLAIDAVDADAGDRVDECLPDLGGELVSDLPQFPLLKNIQDVLAEEDIIAVPLHQPLLDQPLLPAYQRPANVAAEAVVGTLMAHLVGELAVKPSRPLGTDLPLDRPGGQGLDRDRLRLRKSLLVVPDPV
jgi:hypothetical protein